MSWQQYVTRHKAGRSQVELADLVNVSQTAVSRWLKGTQGVDAAVAIRFARAVGDEPLTALVEAGYLTLEEAGATPAQRPDLSRLTNDELLELVRSRMREDGEGNAQHPAPMSDAEGTSATAENTTGAAARAAADDAAGPASLEGSEPRRGGIQRGSLPRRRPTRGRPRPQDTQDGTTDISD